MSTAAVEIITQDGGDVSIYWPGDVQSVSTVVVDKSIDVTAAQVAHRPGKHRLLHDARP